MEGCRQLLTCLLTSGGQSTALARGMLGDKDGMLAVGGLGMRHRLEVWGANSKATEQQCGAGCTWWGEEPKQRVGQARPFSRFRAQADTMRGSNKPNVNVCRERLLGKGRRRGGA